MLPIHTDSHAESTRPCWQRWATRWDSRRHRNPGRRRVRGRRGSPVWIGFLGKIVTGNHRCSHEIWGLNLYPLVIQHSRGKWPIYRGCSQLENSIYKGFSMAMLNNQRVPVTDKTRQNTSKHHVFLQMFSFMTMVKLTISRYCFFRSWQLNAI